MTFYGRKERIIDWCLHPGRLSLFLIFLCVVIIFGAWRAETKQRERYIGYCMSQDARLTEEDCYWKYEQSKPKNTTTVMPVVIPTVR
jgi:hypothetical protein